MSFASFDESDVRKMFEEDLLDILRRAASGALTPEAGLKELKGFPFRRLKEATVDTHRELRQGFPEAIYCEGKSIDQSFSAARAIIESGSDLLATRADQELYDRIAAIAPEARYHEKSRAITLERSGRDKSGLVVVVTAGASDMSVGEEAKVTASIMGANVEWIYDAGVAGLHRLFSSIELIERANAIVVVAGMDGALASVVGGVAEAPVIATPTSIGYGASFGGLAALLSMLNSCASGVAVMNIDNGYGAGALAAKINRMAKAR